MGDAVIMNGLRSALRGQVFEPGDHGYDAARALYNGMIDKRPAIIARCIDVADVVAAVAYGRANALPIAIRCGGHNGPASAAWTRASSSTSPR